MINMINMIKTLKRCIIRIKNSNYMLIYILYINNKKVIKNINLINYIYSYLIFLSYLILNYLTPYFKLYTNNLYINF